MTDEEKASIRDLLKTADINLSERQTNILCRAFELSLTKMYEQGLAEGRKEGYEQKRKESKQYIELLQNEKAELAEDFCKQLEELKKEISVLLSCANCPENKGGYICEKEYNDKCLAQKIEHIKELEAQIEDMKCCENCRKHRNGECSEDKKFFARTQRTCKDWEFTE